MYWKQRLKCAEVTLWKPYPLLSQTKKISVKHDSNLQSVNLKARNIPLSHSSSYLDTRLSPPKAENLESLLMAATNWICTAHWAQRYKDYPPYPSNLLRWDNLCLLNSTVSWAVSTLQDKTVQIKVVRSSICTSIVTTLNPLIYLSVTFRWRADCSTSKRLPWAFSPEDKSKRLFYQVTFNNLSDCHNLQPIKWRLCVIWLQGPVYAFNETVDFGVTEGTQRIMGDRNT